MLALGLTLMAHGDLPGAPRLHQASGVTMPVYVPGERRAVGVIRVGKVYPGHQRRGVFRIGFLPAVILEKVRIQINDPAHAQAVLAEVIRVGQGVSRPEAIELRDVQFLLAGEDKPILEAGTALLDAQGRWRLINSVRCRNGDFLLRIRTAILEQDATAARPTLVWDSPTGEKRIHLFASRNNPTVNEGTQ